MRDLSVQELGFVYGAGHSPCPPSKKYTGGKGSKNSKGSRGKKGKGSDSNGKNSGSKCKNT